MSRITTLPGEKLEEWQQELMNNKYIQEAIEILAEQAAEEAVEQAVEQAAEQAFAKGREKGIAEAREKGIAEKEEEVIDAFRKGEVKGFQEGANNQLEAIIAKMRSKGMTELQINKILDIN